MAVTKIGSTVIGTYEGEAADASITNNNGLDITSEVWENVFNSPDYRQAIDLGWYIGFLGHPEDPNCMDFKNACIVMREGHIDKSGKVYGKFDLIDTPVGRVVKAFIDAGVKFGISVRGAGDIIANSVDPDTFVFRGFDLVTFPAYPEAIPVFSEIAASSDIASQQKYKAVCSAVSKDLDKITSASSIDMLKAQFAPQSDTYAQLETRYAQITNKNVTASESIAGEQIRAITQLYQDTVAECQRLRDENGVLRSAFESVSSRMNRKLKAVERITASQQADYEAAITAAEQKHKTAVAANRRLKDQSIEASKTIQSLKSLNLKYKQEKSTISKDGASKDAIISDLRRKLNETVIECSNAESDAANLAEVNARLKSAIQASKSQLAEYQQAYVALYASAVGISPDQIPVTASTTVSEIKRSISSATNTLNISTVPDIDTDCLYSEEDDSDDGIVSI